MNGNKAPNQSELWSSACNRSTTCIKLIPQLLNRRSSSAVYTV